MISQRVQTVAWGGCTEILCMHTIILHLHLHLHQATWMPCFSDMIGSDHGLPSSHRRAAYHKRLSCNSKDPSVTGQSIALGTDSFCDRSMISAGSGEPCDIAYELGVSCG